MTVGLYYARCWGYVGRANVRKCDGDARWTRDLPHDLRDDYCNTELLAHPYASPRPSLSSKTGTSALREQPHMYKHPFGAVSDPVRSTGAGRRSLHRRAGSSGRQRLLREQEQRADRLPGFLGRQEGRGTSRSELHACRPYARFGRSVHK